MNTTQEQDDTAKRLADAANGVAVGLRALTAEGRGELVPVLALRDYFAAAALTGLATVYPASQKDTAELLAEAAYKLADAMLKARRGSP